MAEHKLRVTTKDVAARAGVSQPTVSLVLSRSAQARVAPETRERVLKAAAELGYRPNVLARGLVQRRSFALGVVVPDIRNPFFADVISGAERVASEQGYAVLLCEAGDTSAERHVETLHGRLIDGVILDAVGAAELPDDLLRDLNVVLIDEPPGGRWPGVVTDAAGAGRLAAEHLLALGHRHFAFIGPAADVHGLRLRERGFVQALRAAGIALESAALRRAPATVAGGREAMRALLAAADAGFASAGAPRPTALFCANDLVALGALKACATAGVRVPDTLSIVGCDDIEMSRLVTPELTTVAVPARELGARAARLLIRQIEHDRQPEAGRSAQHLQQLQQLQRPLPVRLVARGSTAAPPPEPAEPPTPAVERPRRVPRRGGR
jgi:DNA-binding LacI/PurR family transcriptional regulator